MKKYTLFIFSALFTAVLLISACSNSDKAEVGTDPESESTTASVDDPDPQESTDASDTTTKQEVTVTASQEEAPLLWTETQEELTLYAAYDNVSSFAEALEDSKKLNVYPLNHEFKIIARTDTGFYKLENGEFIHVTDLSDHKIEQGTFISSVDATIYTTTPARE